MTEPIQKAVHDVGFLLRDLQDALPSAGALEAFVLLPLIERVAILERDLRAFQEALKHG
jgi:hypothetical protein